MAVNKWNAAPSSFGDVLSDTSLAPSGTGLANGAFSAVETEVDNATDKNVWGRFKVKLASLNPTTGAYVQLFVVQSDGTDYEDAPSSTNPGTHMALRRLDVKTGSAAKVIYTPWFRLPPNKFKTVFLNGCGVALANSGNHVSLETANESVA